MGSEMCIRDRHVTAARQPTETVPSSFSMSQTLVSFVADTVSSAGNQHPRAKGFQCQHFILVRRIRVKFRVRVSSRVIAVEIPLVFRATVC